MQNKTPIIIIAVLSVLALGLGYWYGLPKEGSGGGKNGEGKKEPDFLKKGLVAYYPFNGNAKDESGNDYNGTQKGGVTFISDRFGKTSSACSFDGKDDYIHVDKPLGLIDVNECTVLAWMQPLETAANKLSVQIQGAQKGGNSDSMNIRFNGIGWYANGNAGPFQSEDNCPNCWGIFSKVELGNGWRHVAGTWKRKGDNIVVTLFINGEAIQSATSGLLIQLNTYTIMGASSWPLYSGGTLDDFRIYDRALSDAEVKALYEFEKAN
jgi:hypothetical protein